MDTIAFFKSIDPNAWIEFPDEDGNFAAAEDSMIDVASAWAMDESMAVNIQIDHWMNNTPIFAVNKPDCVVYSETVSAKASMWR